MLSHAKSLLQLWDSARAEALASQHEIQGSFQFGMHTSVALNSLHRYLPALLEKHPRLEIKLKHDLSRKLVEGVVNLTLDLAIVANPVRHPDLVITKLYDDEVTFWCKASAKNMEEMLKSGDAVLFCDPDMMQAQWLLKRAQKSGYKFNRIVTSSNLEVVASLTASGAGVGILPASIASSTQPNKLKSLACLPSYHDDICLVYRHENRSVKAMQAIIHTIKKSY